MKSVNIPCRVIGTHVRWEGPDEILRVDLQPQPAKAFEGEQWTLEVRGPKPADWASSITGLMARVDDDWNPGA